MKKKTQNIEFTVSRPNLSWILVILALLCFFFAIAIFVIASSRADLSKDYLEDTSDLKVLSHRMPKEASEAVKGKENAFLRLQNARDEFETTWKTIKDGERDNVLVTTNYSDIAEEEVQAVERVWSSVRQSTDSIIDNKEAVIQLHKVAATLNETVPQLQDEFKKIVKTLRDTNASADSIYLAQQQLILAEGFVSQINNILESQEKQNRIIIAGDYRKAVQEYGRALDSFKNGNSRMNIRAIESSGAKERLNTAIRLFTQIKDLEALVTNNHDKFYVVKQAKQKIFRESGELFSKVTELSEQVNEASSGKFLSPIVGAFATSLAVLSLFGVIFESLRQARARYENEERVRREEEQRNQKNQEAILRLLDELGDLADGDLTIQTTVTEDFTGAIADSINFTIDQLRSLVSTINETAVKVSSAAQETQATAMQLAEASEHQAQEIAGASAAVNEMAASIDQVSANAAESASVAERSVTIANKGSEVVHNTIRGMDTIREQIQETAKRIKRLGESSQEIGDIVSLITDIADQTNILALNAAIQASMAGDAGRGFAVVADEVQRLAERASAATKQIEALVKTIQTDTSEAVISMEHTTAEVVRGARLAQDAGVALEEIENVSRNLADLIQNISNAARQQAASAGHISNTMNVIQEITSQTSSGTTATATSIGNLAELAVQMRNSVAGFKLPDQR